MCRGTDPAAEEEEKKKSPAAVSRVFLVRVGWFPCQADVTHRGSSTQRGSHTVGQRQAEGNP